ncbi:MAG: ABC transporter substrate-binding protein, partial [Lachnospiraceae bacterium]|nr:ABC transporter substrate-binding protein [Lachnospiraceae bacterium]
IITDYEGMSGDAVLTTENAYVEYKVDVPETGLYELSLEYYPVEGKNSEIQRSFFVDGELPYGELSLIEFSRVWSTDVAQASFADGIYDVEWNRDVQGNDMKPTSVEIPEWTTASLYDNNGYITEPLSLYLEQGVHTITINSQREPMLLRRLILSNREPVRSYAEVKAAWDAQGAQPTSGQNIMIQAENASKTSSQMLYPKQDQSSPAVSPSSAKALLNNSIGGESWSDAGQWIEWEFTVPESGYYEISMFDKQSFMRGIYVSRKIMLDGVVPFEEMSDYGFTYSSNWRMDTLKDADGNPYQFYLEAGRHTLRMEVVLGEFSGVIAEVQDCFSKLNAIYRKLLRITGVSPD